MTRLTPSPFKETPNGEPWSDEQNGRLIRLGNENPDLSWEEFKIKFDFPHSPDELEKQYRHLMTKNRTLKRSRSEDDDGDATRYSTPTRPRPKRSKSESNVDDSTQQDAFNQSDPIRPRSPDWRLPSSDASNKSRKTQQPPDQSVSMRDSYSHYRSPEPEISSTSTSRSPQAQTQRERTPPVNPAASTHSHDKNPTMPSTFNLISLPHRPAPAPPRAPQIPSSSRPQSGDAQRVEDILPYHMRRGSLPSEGNMSSIGSRLALVHRTGESLLEELEWIGRNITTVSGQLSTVFASEPTEPPARAIPPVNTGPGLTTAALEQRPAGSSGVVESQNHDAGEGPGGDGQTREDMGGEETSYETCMDTDAPSPREYAGEKR